MKTDKGRIGEAVMIITRYGMIDGSQHKQWVLDQVLRTLLGEKDYRTFAEAMSADRDESPWDEGIAP